MTGRRLALALAATALALIPAEAYQLLSYRWSGVSTVTMELQLGSSGTLIDGSAGWNVVAENALALWNAEIGNLQFRVVRDSTAAVGSPNSRNNVIFDDDVFGEPFGDSTVAVAYTWSSGGRTLESDVVFNSARSWNSYRGSQRSGVVDIRRVALHEFGHVLGLDHPDQHGQSVSAIMNSRASNVDALQADDIDGGRALYGAPSTTPTTTDTLTAGNRLTSGQSLVSSNARYRLLYQSDGNLVLYDGSTAVWATNTGGTSTGSAVLQGDGNFVVYDAQGTARFASGSSGASPRLVLQSDGNLVVYSGSTAIWTRHTGSGSVATDSLSAGGRLTSGQSLRSRNARYRLLYQSDGNLVLYDDTAGGAVWTANTAGTTPGSALLQTNGNFVVYDGQNAARFATGSIGSQARLLVQNDGNIVIYRGDGAVIWSR